jgi:WD40 repeat protein
MILTHIFEEDNSKDATLKLHKKAIKALAVNPDCSLIASASANGTVIKITSVDSGEIL